MEIAFLFDTLAVTVEQIDFLDPKVIGEPDGRERGVRLEIREMSSVATGTVYVSPVLTLRPAACRVDLLESKPGAADRMHWHPGMEDGEPADRLFDDAIPRDPLGWVAVQLQHVDRLLDHSGNQDLSHHAVAIAAIADHANAIVAATRTALESARQPWPSAIHDSRGMAAVPADT